jgi:hypothetical protein
MAFVTASFAPPQPALIGGPCVEARRRLPHGASLLGLGDGRGNRERHRLGDLVLHREDVGEIAIVALGPDMLAGFALDKLRGYADPIAGFGRLPPST